MKQPVLGLVASALIIALSLGLIALIPAAKFLGSVTYALICIIPMQLIVGITWGCKQPSFAASRRQPTKGILLLLVTILTGIVVMAVHFFTMGQAIRPIAPMLLICMIVSVIIAFWWIIMMGGWPFMQSIKNPVAAGLTMLAACYVLNYILFRIFFSFEFMKGAPVYVASLDPKGLYNANLSLVFYMTAICVLFLLLHFDLWPLTSFPGVMKQPVLGIVWTVLSLVIGGAAFYAGVFVLKMDPLQFMVKVPVGFIFGTIVIINMVQGSIFAKLKQPVKGIVSAAVSMALGYALELVLYAVEPAVSGRLAPGPPGNDLERWMASALLGVTFPFLIFYADFFEYWPLKRAAAPQAASAPATRQRAATGD